MKRSVLHGATAALALTVLIAHLPELAHAQSPLGIGPSETAMPAPGWGGPFAGILAWINAQQQGFYRALTGALRGMRDGTGGGWLLVGLSFAYGVFHAAGPGHGKAVISSYMLANEVALRRGVALSFISALMQGTVAILLMAAVFLALRGTAVSMGDATRFLEIASYALVTGFGLWLLWRKAGPLVIGRPARALSAAHVHHHGHDHGHDHHHEHHHHHGHEACPSCGHSHAPDPALISGAHFDWKSAWTAIVAVGLRPCAGALIVLSFAFLNGLWAVGILSVLAMSIGTAITVSALAVTAVTAKNWAVAMAGDGHAGNRIHHAIEIAGAAFVFLIGLAMLTASLSS